MLYPLHGIPLVEWVYRRVMRSTYLNRVVFAIPTTTQDDELNNFLCSIGAEVFRGSELNVVDRFYQAAQYTEADTIIRICADNPFVSGEVIDILIDFFKKNKFDYAYNHVPKNCNWPDGLGAEICSSDLLHLIYLNANGTVQREHLFNYILENKQKFNIGSAPVPTDLAYPELKFDVDTIQDLVRLRCMPYRVEMTPVEIIRTALG